MHTPVLETRQPAEIASLIATPSRLGAAHHDEDDLLVSQAIRSAYVEDDDLVLWWASLLEV